jgi:hypothetical protein
VTEKLTMKAFFRLATAVLAFCVLFSYAQTPVTLTVGRCSQNPQAWCLQFNAGTQQDQFLLSQNSSAYPVSWGTIGNHFPGPLPAAYVYWQTGYPQGGVMPSISLSIFDLNGRGMVARTDAPGANPALNFTAYTIHNTYFGIVNGPQGKQYPFLAPGQRYLNVPTWNYLCIFDPDMVNQNTVCGQGFKAYNATFPNATTLSGFRHNGGWQQDVNNDGWDDINLPFLHGYILVIDGQTGATIALNQIHPAQSDPYYANASFFDSGRLYGSFTLFTAIDGNQDVMIAAGEWVGSFNDVDCNVSRYMAVLESAVPNDPRSRRLKWTKYISFMDTVFYWPPGPTMAQTNIARPGDFINHCVHRVSNSVFYAGQRPITIYNYFTENPLVTPEPCQEEVWLEWSQGFPEILMQQWRTCANNAGLPMPGFWSAQAIDLENGAAVNNWPNVYFWDRIYKFVPGKSEVFLVEPMPTTIPFGQQGYIPLPMMVVGIDANFQWQQFGTFPVAGRPLLRPSTSYQIPIGVGFGASFGDVWSTVTRRRSDGLVDVQLQDGTWIGYSTTQHTFVVEP